MRPLLVAAALTLAASAVGLAQPRATRFASQKDSLRVDLLMNAAVPLISTAPDSAITLMSEAREITRRSVGGADHPHLAGIDEFLGELYFSRGEYVRAAPLIEEALAIYRRLFKGTDRAELARSVYFMAMIDAARGRITEAVPLLEEALAIHRRLANGADTPTLLSLANDVASIYERTGRYAEAEPLYREVVTTARRLHLGKDHPDIARALHNLANFYTGRGRPADAEPLYVDALAISRRLYRDDHPELASLLNNLGSFYDHRGRYAEAEPLYTEAVAICRRLYKGGDHPDLATDIGNLAGFYVGRGRYAEAEPLLVESLEIARRLYDGNDHLGLARSMSNMAYYYELRGRYDEAEPLHVEALAMYRRLYKGIDNLDVARALGNVAQFQKRRGHYAETEVLYHEALSMLRRLYGSADSPVLATTLNAVAHFAMTRGRNAEAEGLYRESLEMSRRLYHGIDHPELATIIGNLATHYAQLGRYAEAEPLQVEGLAMMRRIYAGIDHPDLAAAISALALSYHLRDRYSEAEPLYVEALAMRRRLFAGGDHPQLARSIHNMAAFYSSQRRSNDAEAHFGEALSMMRRLSQGRIGDLDLLMTLMNTAAFHHRYGSADTALALVDDARRVMEEIWNSSAAFESGDEQLQSHATISGAIDVMLDIYLSNIDRKPALRGELMETGFLEKGAVLEQLARQRRAVSRSMSTDDTTRQIWDTYQQKNQRLSYQLSAMPTDTREIVPWQRELDRLTGEVNALEKALARRSAIDRSALVNASWQHVRDALALDEAVVDILGVRRHDPMGGADSTRYVAVVVRGGDSLPSVVSLGGDRQLEGLLNVPPETRGSYMTRGTDVTIAGDNVNDRGNALYRLVWQPIDSLLGGVRRVRISTEGVLSKISFAAIPYPDGSLVVDRYTIGYLLSPRDLVRSTAVSNEARRTAAVFGGARFSIDSMRPAATPNRGGITVVNELPDNRGKGVAWSYLTGTRIEARDVAKAFADRQWTTSLDTGMHASEERFKSLQGERSPRVLHIATHGFFLPHPDITRNRPLGAEVGFARYNRPMVRSGIILSGANRVWSGQPPIPGVEDGIVTAYEVAQMDLSNTELVVLSACETGLGDVTNGEGVFGLQRAFAIAGARSIIMSLWKVPDAQTVELMRLFYQNWLEKKLSRPEAFAEAQKAMRAKYPPYYWGAFVMVGE